ncbi:MULTISPECIES: 3-deoxy-7-phosphoheptulonate synthase [unclassified Breznakia]|uniref:3-deoxy-7-phosphoheptulonate synthase n=1 Tax=unclassified Breznakia TaxID=2623764 RepID=UPI002474131A|nr:MULTISPECIES: 3-deoxy-7-phosphoheptulonate synthase [unclassified Breznakia]MDH6367287.1 3-deoxy-7-phosphoheptulonate synthase [Breznakia sp. PH1-1]MDH6404466.1 3-deoxy-7-phosphoheptulonate synthase [Breznakia sp. PF1-11]MDH6412143.1 3-deoxy-7-phosphoheptulonate synthase [Breznakia sp. PFB1-11]MDH6414454.1 3-deoxy-7-phosphoheptulonate synthase [Breznakia sp. PFB1-14]MDH6416839.1 3-deoxy-7-phosphoheptulonate synthase [Breznakia sp. PFB1-4]
MIITIKKNADQQAVKKLIDKLETLGVTAVEIQGSDLTIYGLTGDTTAIDEKRIMANESVEHVTRIAAKYKLASRQMHPTDTIFDINGIKIGGQEKIVVIGGPCSVESEEMVVQLAKDVKDAGGKMLRGGAYKPRTSPYAFQGMQTDGILAMVKAREETGLPIVSELMSADKIDEFETYVDVIQIGARNMQNFELLKELGKRTTKPILLKRGFANTIDEWIMSAEYIMANGNPNVIFCERGIRTFETETRNTLDLSVIPIIKRKTHLPIVIDPSHATGDWSLVESASLAAVAAGADGLIIEVHNDPENAFSDGDQCLKPKRFKALIKKAREIAQVIGRDI